MKMHRTLALVLAAVAGLMLQTNLGAGDKKPNPPEKKKGEAAKDLRFNGELTDKDNKDRVRTDSYCKTFTFKMIKGHTYQIDMKTADKDNKKFDPYLRLENPDGVQVASDDDGGGFPNARIIYKAEETGNFKICATTFGDNSTGKFTLTARDRDAPITLKNEKGQATYTGTLDKGDPLYKDKKLHKLFTFRMEAGKTYQIDHMSRAFDAYLYLEDPDGKLLAEDDDGGEGLNSRIIYKAEKTGNYRMIATSLDGNDVGEFTFSVREK